MSTLIRNLIQDFRFPISEIMMKQQQCKGCSNQRRKELSPSPTSKFSKMIHDFAHVEIWNHSVERREQCFIPKNLKKGCLKKER